MRPSLGNCGRQKTAVHCKKLLRKYKYVSLLKLLKMYTYILVSLVIPCRFFKSEKGVFNEFLEFLVIFLLVNTVKLKSFQSCDFFPQSNPARLHHHLHLQSDPVRPGIGVRNVVYLYPLPMAVSISVSVSGSVVASQSCHPFHYVPLRVLGD